MPPPPLSYTWSLKKMPLLDRALASQYRPMGGEWYLEKRGSRKILAGSRNLGSVNDKSRSRVFAWFVFTFFESRNFLPKSLGLGFLTRISASRRVSDFTIRHPYYREYASPGTKGGRKWVLRGHVQREKYEFARCVSGNSKVMHIQYRMTSQINQLSTLLVYCSANEAHMFFFKLHQIVTTKISVT